MSLTAELGCVSWWTHRVEFFFRVPPSRAIAPGNPDNPLLELFLVCRIGKMPRSCAYNHRAFQRVTLHCKGLDADFIPMSPSPARKARSRD